MKQGQLLVGIGATATPLEDQIWLFGLCLINFRHSDVHMVWYYRESPCMCTNCTNPLNSRPPKYILLSYTVFIYKI